MTGNFGRPWLDAGHPVYIVDVQHEPGARWDGLLCRVGADVHTLTVPDYGWAFAAGWPPCTDLAVSGARWFATKGEQAYRDAIALADRVRSLVESTGAPWFCENPVSRLASAWGPAPFTFHPYEYGGYRGGHDDGYTKRTCLWYGAGFIPPTPRPIALAADHDRIHMASPGPERANFRSATPMGFSQAVYEAHCRGQRAPWQPSIFAA